LINIGEAGGVMKSAVHDPEVYLPTPAEFHMLLALAASEQHGYAIMQQINEDPGGTIRIGPATLYRSIKRLLDDGLIEETQERPDPSIDDERRRYYRITDFGLAVAGAEAKRLAKTLQKAWLVLPMPGTMQAWAHLQQKETNPIDTGTQDP
jgi:DNA-binding PadR family transcriptional regulator